MSPMEIIQFERPAMACTFGISVVGDDPEWLERAVEDAFDEISRIESLLNMYDPESILSQINAAAADGPVGLVDEVLGLLLMAGAIWEQTDGAFDPTIGPLVRLWRQWRADGTAPDPATVDEVRQRVGMQHVRFHVHRRTVFYDCPGLEIDLGAIGKGYAVDRAIEVLEDYGIEHCLVHGGTSTIAARGAMDSESGGWRMGITDLTDPDRMIDVLTLSNEACACSNQQNQYYEYDGRQLGHVIDPRTGWPAPAESSMLVVCSSAAQSDALSTAMLVLGAGAADELARTFADVRVHCLSPGIQTRAGGYKDVEESSSNGSTEGK